MRTIACVVALLALTVCANSMARRPVYFMPPPPLIAGYTCDQIRMAVQFFGRPYVEQVAREHHITRAQYRQALQCLA